MRPEGDTQRCLRQRLPALAGLLLSWRGQKEGQARERTATKPAGALHPAVHATPMHLPGPLAACRAQGLRAGAALAAKQAL